MATDKQIAFILSLGRVDHLSQLTPKHGISLTQREKQWNLSKRRASEIIDELKAL